MTTTIRGKSGKSALRELLDQHDQCGALLDLAIRMTEPFQVVAPIDDGESGRSIDITKDELMGVLYSRLAAINTRLENLGLKIGDEVENAQ